MPPITEACQMYLSYNHKIITEQHLHLPYHDRAFNYGDGLFESIIYHKGKARFLNDHLKRLKKGMHALGIQGGQGIKKNVLSAQIDCLLHKNKIKGSARLKLMVWRKPGGLYTPENLHFNLLIISQPTEFNKQNPTGLSLGLSQNVRLAYSSLSRFKTCNALPYVLAGLEKQHTPFDELLLLDQKGRVAECTASNLFWIKKDIVFTPSLKTGCVAGVSRKNILKRLEKQGFKTEKVKAGPEALLEADHIFTSNVSRIAQIGTFAEKQYKPFPLLKELF